MADLVLRETQVTDSGLAHLKGLSNLSKLDLSFTHVTDVGLTDQSALSKLSELNLCGTRVTPGRLKEIRDAFPVVIIY
jgi:hypothetical protein